MSKIEIPPAVVSAILSAFLTALFNVIFYRSIKAKIDKSIEKHKIAYSGIFKEKIDIYKKLLEMLYDLKSCISRYQYEGTTDESRKIMDDINSFIRFYEINRPFLSENIIINFKKIRSELQEVFDNLYRYHYLSNQTIDNEESKAELWNLYTTAVNKLRDKKHFESLEYNIIKEIRDDLRVD